MYKAGRRMLKRRAVYFYSESWVTDAVVLGNSSHNVYRFLRMRFRDIKKPPAHQSAAALETVLKFSQKTFLSSDRAGF